MEEHDKKDSPAVPPACKRRRALSRRALRNYLILAAIVLALCAFLEFVSISYPNAGVFTFFGAGVSLILTIILPTVIKPGEHDVKAEKGDDLYVRLRLGIKNIRAHIYNDAIVLLLFVSLATVTCSAACAQVHLVGRMVNTVGYVFGRLGSYSDVKPPEESPMSTETPTNEPYVDSPPPAPPQSTADAPPLPLPTPYMMLMDPGRRYTLALEDWDALYFLGGEYEITDWSDTTLIYSTVLARINDLRGCARQNEFNDNATEHVKNEIAAASQQEQNLCSSEELDEIIDVRKDAYSSYPMYRLAKLIAEDYTRYALAYDAVSGDYGTIEYYYGNSVRWYHEALCFESLDNAAVKDLLEMIKWRYHDLAEIAPKGSDCRRYSTLLSQAYEWAAGQY